MVNRHGWILAFALMLSGCVAYPGYYDTGYPAYPAYPDYAAAPYYYGPGYPYYGAWAAYGGFYGSFNYSYGRGCCWGHG